MAISIIGIGVTAYLFTFWGTGKQSFSHPLYFYRLFIKWGEKGKLFMQMVISCSTTHYQCIFRLFGRALCQNFSRSVNLCKSWINVAIILSVLRDCAYIVRTHLLTHLQRARQFIQVQKNTKIKLINRKQSKTGIVYALTDASSVRQSRIQ